MNDPALAAHADQLAAATAHAARWFDQLDAMTEPTSTDDPATAAAMRNWISVATTHAAICFELAARPLQPVIARLDLALVVCADCHRHLPRPQPAGRCDWCHGPTDNLALIAAQLAAVTAIGYGCPRCNHAWQ